MDSIVVWFTGLSGAGKTTLSSAVAELLRTQNVSATVLDGDVIRPRLCSDLGFSPEDRRESLRRINQEASRLSQEFPVVLVAAIAPYRDIRSEIRSQHSHFLEIFVNAPLQVCEKRDPKGLYRRARSGELPEFTGISSPYEVPLHPDVECHSDTETVEHSSRRVLAAITHLLTTVARDSCPEAAIAAS